ncbi:MAG: hypothetical protein J6T26_01510, partial [Firmicutes bacterium]|nr:hypothetical protein [Bacillota bacterium]
GSGSRALGPGETGGCSNARAETGGGNARAKPGPGHAKGRAERRAKRRKARAGATGTKGSPAAEMNDSRSLCRLLL